MTYKIDTSFTNDPKIAEIASRAFDAGYNGRLSEDPSTDIPEEYSDVWSDNWNAGVQDARHDSYEAEAEYRQSRLAHD
tara:strand:- start:471 stop:704 length:234 start_codon:yes stop_codon:yes gene_type:complete